MKKLSFLAIFVVYTTFVFSQFSIQNGFNAQQLGNNLAGSNISVTNASVSGANVQFGTFQFAGAGFPLSSGVVLSSGSIFDCPGPNSSSSTSTSLGGAGNALLDALAGIPTNDAVELKFDFTVQTDKIEFNYIFASEEYNEYVGSSFNDVFGFFISGPGIVGEENIAVVPNTNVAVAINNINLNSYWQYYNNNETNATNIEFDGYTTVLTAKKTGLIPCQTYTLKLILADAGDGAYDSGVLLQEGSLVQGTVSASTNTYSANNIALEGCVNASFTFSLDSARLTNTYINYRIGGSATNGIDYTQIDTILIIPAGQTNATIIIDAKTDGIAEGQESVELLYEPILCQGYDTIKMFIQDYQSLEFQTIPTDLSCFESGDGQLDFNITGGQSPFSINLQDSATGLITTYNSYPISGLSAGTYNIQVLDAYGCWAEDIVAGAIFDADTTFLPDGNGVSYSTSIDISGLPASQTLIDVNQLQSICLEMEHSFMGDLLIELQAPNGTLLTLKQQPGGAVSNLGEPVASGPNDNSNNLTPGVGYQYCFTNISTYGTMVSEANQHTYTYVSQTGVTLSDKYLPAGTYQSFESLSNLVGTPLNGTWTIIVTDEIPNNNGYIFNWSISIAADRPDSIITLTQPNESVITPTTVLPSCGLNNGSINLTITGGNPPFTFLWSNGATTQNITNVGAGTHFVTITDNSGCVEVKTLSLPNSSAATISEIVTNETCVGANNGSINLTVSGGTPPYSFLWSSGQSTEDINALSPGNYSVQISDGAGCISASGYEIMAASTMVITGTVTNENCGNIDGAVAISIYGGILPFTYLWSNGSTTQNITSLQQGTYNVTVNDANSCSKTASFSIINLVGNCIPNCDLVVQNSTVSDEICGNANGSIQLDIFTTNLPYFTTWSNGGISTTLNDLNAGNYNVTITDAVNCVVEQSFSVNNLVGTLVISTVTVSDENCGNSNGAINITPSGGVMPYYYNWSNGAVTQDISGLSASAYNLTLNDANSCAIHETYIVDNNSGTLDLIYGNAMNSDCSLANGSIDISISGGAYPVTYLWSNGATTQDLIGLLPGSFTCTVSDGTNCKLITPTYVVNSNSGSMAFTYINAKNEVCENSLGEIKILVNGGSVPYSYLWSNGATTQNIYNLNSGTYSATITDNNGCLITTGNVNIINVSGTLSLSSVTTSNEICSNGNGSVQIAITGGTLPYSFNWNTGSTSQNLNNLSVGSYSCLVSDSVGCSFTVNANILNEQGTLNIENFIVNDETCGNGSGSINLIISGGTSPITYVWSSGQTTEDISSLNAGTYNVTVQDSQGCLISGSTQLNNQAGNLQVSIQSISNEVCSSGNGAINIAISGGTQPYAILWSNAATTEDLTNLSAGNYSCSITDNSGCNVNTGNITINNSAGTLSISSYAITNENCGNANGAIDITVIGGTNPKTYLWSNATTTQDISGLSAGSYTVTVSDANSCSITANYTVGQSSGAFQYSNVQITDEVCNNNGGSISLTVSGGTTPYSYNWSNGATTSGINSLTSNIYSLTITEAGGCSIQTGQLTVNNYSGSFSVVSINETAATCGNNNGSVNVTLSGGVSPISYTWSNGALTQDLTALISGVYSCTATDNNGCELNYSAIVPNDAGNLTVSGITTNALCGQTNGTIDITVNGGASPYTYLWNNGSVTEDLSGLVAGNYTVFIEDIDNCFINQSFSVISSGAVTVSAINVTDENCGNSQGEIEVIVSGGTAPYQFNWSTTSSVSCCNYTLEMDDYYGYGWNGAYIEVLVNGTNVGYYASNGVLTIQNIPVCTGDILSLNYNSGWDDSGIFYSLKNSDGTVIFSDGPYPAWGMVYSGSSSCTFNPPNSNILTNLSAGDYSVDITDVNGCNATASATVDNNSGSFAISANVVTNDFCNSGIGAINITVTGGNTPYQYNWSNGKITQDISLLTEGTYTVIITGSTGCQISGTYTILNNTGTLAFDTAIVNNTYCGDNAGAIDITVSGTQLPITYLWNNGSTSEDLTNISSGNYAVTITDATGCAINESFDVINQTNGLTLTYTSVQPLCGNNDGSIALTISGGVSPYSIIWSNGAVTEDLSNLYVGNYSVTVTDAGACSSSETIALNGASSVVINSMNVTDENCGNSNGSINVSASGGSQPYTYQWGLANSSPCCNYVMTLYDLSSDGWNGNSVDVLINGSSIGTYTILYDFSISYNIPVCTNDIIQLVYNEVSMDNENYIYLQDTDGNLIFNTGPIPSNGSIYTGTSSCDLFFPSSANIYNLNEGDYAVTITDANSCSVSDTATVYNNTNGFIISSSTITADYCSSNAGAINITVTGGATPYQYYWSNGVNTQDLNNLSQGVYTVTIYDSYYCMLEESFTISNDPGTLAFGIPVISNTYCGSSSGAIDISVSGLSTPFIYSWSNGAVTQDLTNIISGFYEVTVIDASGCQIQDTFTVVNLTNGLALSFVTVQPMCGSSDGAVNMTISGGVSPYTILWSNGASTEDLSNLSANNYSVSVTDASTCMVFETIDLNGSGNVAISAISITDEYCGNSNGSIYVSVSGSATPYSYQWALAGDTPCCNYTLYPYDAVGDGWEGASVDVIVNGSIVGTYTLEAGPNYISIPIPVCTGDNIELNYNTGTADNDNYVYLQDFNGNWVLNIGPNPGTGIIYTGTSTCQTLLPNSAYLSNLSEGDYIVTITDANGCSVSDTAVVNNNTNGFVISTIVKTDEYCSQNNGAINISVSGGLTPYQYYWSNGANTQDLNNLSEGIYTVSIYDNNYCMLVETITIVNDPGTLAFGSSTITDTYCGNSVGAIDLTVLGDELPLIYTWSNGATSQDLSNIMSGDYLITVVDASGCIIQDTFTVVNITNGLALASTSTDAFCGNSMGSINLTISGGAIPYSIIWSNGSTAEDLNNIVGGNYTVTVTDASSCSTTKIVTVIDTGSIIISSLNIVDEICDNSEGEITIIATGGAMPYTYTWSQAVSNPCCSYTLQMFDSFGDSWNGGFLEVYIDGISIGMFSAIGTGSDEFIDVCNGQQIKLDYTSGTWEDENTYKLINSAGTVVFSDGPNPTVGTVYTGTSSCVFAPPSTNQLTGLSAGDYALVISEANGCTLDTTITVNNSAGNLTVNSIITDDNCGNNAGSIALTVSGGVTPYSYNWSNGSTSEDLTNITAGDFTISIYDNTGCQLIETYTVINQTGTLAISNSNVTGTYCGNNVGAIALTVTGGVTPYTYLWSNGGTSASLSNLVAGVYDVTISDNVNCIVYGSYDVINQTNGLAVSYTSTNETCNNNGGSIDLTISGGVGPYSVIWSNSSTTQDLFNLNEGNYTYTVTDNSGCVQSETVTIQNIQGNLFIILNDIQGDYCGWGYGSINISVQGGTAPYNYLWSNGFTSQDISNVVFGDYTVTVTDNNGCTDVDSYEIQYQAIFEVVDTIIQDASCYSCADGSIDITTNSGTIVTYQWDNGEITEDIYNLTQGNYTVTMTDEYGCTLTETYNVSFPIDVETTALLQGSVNIYPNPSKGIVNVAYKMKASSEVSIEVYNMLGEIVYKSNKQSSKEGTIAIDLKEGIEGVYTFRIKAGESFIQKKVVLMKM